jgi:putative hydrolase of HD superfamily
MTDSKQLANTLIDFMYFCNQLKLEVRHCWFENGRRESVAEHSWQLALFAITVHPHLSQPTCLETILKMALIHDLVEIEAKDIPLFEQDADVKKAKFLRESQAIDNIRSRLSTAVGDQIYQLWHDYEKQETIESRVVRALDKLEGFIAHNVSDIDTFAEREKQMYTEYEWLHQPCEVDPLLLEIANIVNQHGKQKIQSAEEIC